MAKIFNDSKTFVDMKLKRPPNETVQLFREFMNEHDHSPSREDVIQFVSVSPAIIETALIKNEIDRSHFYPYYSKTLINVVLNSPNGYQPIGESRQSI